MLSCSERGRDHIVRDAVTRDVEEAMRAACRIDLARGGVAGAQVDEGQCMHALTPALSRRREREKGNPLSR